MPKKVDASQTQLVQVFRALGLTVAITSGVGDGFPDIVVGGLMPCVCGSQRRVKQTKIVEIKTPKGILTPDQKEFHAIWRGQLDVIRTEEDVLHLIGARIRS
ncbi:MAG TPA: hypothetical protein VGC91_08005 [Pyrinomonadaceae bacterium]|jgi:hypothetical protein